jgi:hypothetical protein
VSDGSDRSVALARWFFGTTRARHRLAGANTRAFGLCVSQEMEH